MKHYLFTSESVSEGHPDKVADQISDAILDEFLAHDPQSKVACETLVTTGQVVLAGEVKSEAYIDLQSAARRTIARIGYTEAAYKFEAESCGVFSAIHEQSADINRGVDRGGSDPMAQGAGDQGMMFGYANNETDTYMPLPIALAHDIMYVLAEIRREGKQMTYLRPDSKSQVTVEYDENHRACRIDTIVVSTQHDEFITAAEAGSQEEADARMLAQIRHDVEHVLMPRLLAERVHTPEVRRLFEQGDIKYFVNPTGKFVIGGPHGDTGLTGRKIIVDTLWRPRSTRRRRFLGQGPLEGRPFGCLRRPLHCQEHGGRRRGRRDAGAAELCHRRGRAHLGVCRHQPPQPRGYERCRNCAEGYRTLRPAPRRH